MAGRVLRNSKGQFNGSTKGFGSKVGRFGARTPQSKSDGNRSNVVRYTARRANRVGLKAAGKVAARGALSGAIQGAKVGATVGILAAARGVPGKRIAVAAGTAVGLGIVGGVVRSGPVGQYRRSASASAQLGLANRKVSVDRKLGLTRQQSLSQTYKGYGGAARTIKAATAAGRKL